MNTIKAIILFYRLYTLTYKDDKQLIKATLLTKAVFGSGERQLKKYGILSNTPGKPTTEKQWQGLKTKAQVASKEK